MKLNLGCGDDKFEGFVNLDSNPHCSPDLCIDIRFEDFPYEDNSVEEVWAIHSFEHIERKYWVVLLKEIQRVLVPFGKFVLSYPEFYKCAKLFIDNRGDNSFWHATLYGRQLDPYDFHVSAMDTMELVQLFESAGFFRFTYKEESDLETFNTTMVCYKNPQVTTREDVVKKALNL